MTALLINVTQQPALLSSLENVKLNTDIYYDNNRQKDFLQENNTLIYEWLYSVDDGKTFRTLNENSANLTIDLDTININFIYKLKISIDRPSSEITSNTDSSTGFITNKSNKFLLSNQENDDSEVWYSTNIKINHNIDIADIIVDFALNDIIEQLEDQIDFGLTSDAIDIQENESSQISIIPDDETATIVEVDTDETSSTLWFPGLIDCYTPATMTSCGITINYCIYERRSILVDGFSNCGSIHDCPANGCVLDGGPIITANGPVGNWKNIKVGNSYAACFTGDGFPVAQDPQQWDGKRSKSVDSCGEPIISDSRYDSLVLCDDPKKTYQNYYDCANPPNVGNMSCPGQVVGNQCDPGGAINDMECLGEFKRFMFPTNRYGCLQNKYYYASTCKCNGEILGSIDTNPATCQANTDQCKTVAPPSLSYYCRELGVTVNVDAEVKEGKYTGVLNVNFGPVAAPPGTTESGRIGGGLTGGVLPKSYTAYLQGSADAANYSVDPSITLDVTRNAGKTSSECSIKTIKTSSDPWGGCIEAGDCYEHKDIPGALRCFTGDQYYKIEGFGSITYNCYKECQKNTPTTATVPAFRIYPVTTRPPEDLCGLLSLAEAEAKLEKDNEGKAYAVRTDTLRAGFGSSCVEKCKNFEGFPSKNTTRFSTNGGIKTGTLGLRNPCVKCGCKDNDDCDGCGVCVDGECIEYPNNRPTTAFHPCEAARKDGGTVSCCVAYDALGKKTVSCARSIACETCQDAQSLEENIPTGSITGSVAKVSFDPYNPEKGCCFGVVYDPRCQDCDPIYKTLRDRCRPPKECRLTGDTTTWVDEDDFAHESDNYHCIIPPCPPCQIEADDYDTTGNCISYNDTPAAKANCEECEPIDNPDYPLNSDEPQIPNFYSTLDEGQTCCQTGATTFVPCSNCCADSETGYNTCCPGAEDTCCDGACYATVAGRTICCNGKEAAFEDACNLCSFDQYGQQESQCDTYYSCCTKTVSGVEFFTGCYSNAYCDCQTCKGGKVVDVESDDPDDCCYAGAAPQSIFYEP